MSQVLDDTIEGQTKKIQQDYNSMDKFFNVQMKTFGGNLEYFEKGIKGLKKYVNSIKNEDQKSRVLEYLTKLETKNNYAKQLLNDCDLQSEIIKETYSEKDYLQPSKNASKKKGYLEDKIKDHMMKFSEYAEKLKHVSGDISENFQSISKELGSGTSQGKEKPHTLDHLVAIGTIAIFGGSVLYALSNLRPENFTSGAFTVGASSPIVIATTLAAIVLFLFFLTHHKLESGPKTEYD